MSEKEASIFIARALTLDGKPMPIVGISDPIDCAHDDTIWSSDMDLCCQWCGARLFLPGSSLARLPGDTIEKMHQCWRDAGWPEWWGRENHWRPWAVKQSEMRQHQFFSKFGGIPVRKDKLEAWDKKWGGNGA